MERVDKWSLNKAAFVVPRLWPRVGAEQVESRYRVGFEKPFKRVEAFESENFCIGESALFDFF